MLKIIAIVYLASATAFVPAGLCAAADTTDTDALLIQLQRDIFKYFLDYTPSNTGLTSDSSAPQSPCSIAGVGFYLASLIVAVENNWISKTNAYYRARTTLTTLKKNAAGKNGFYYHFISPHTGKRVWGSELSSIDTALLMAGVLLAGDYFPGTKVAQMSRELYERVDWQWMLNGSLLIAHGYKPEQGFLPYYWDGYSEHLILQALAIGSPTHAVPREAWNEWHRYEEYVNDKRIVYCITGSLFTYQFSHAFIDFSRLRDIDINYAENSANAVNANRDFCERNAAHHVTYNDHFWGLSACLGPRGYMCYGAVPGRALSDGTVAPYSVIASLPFAPDKARDTIGLMYTELKERLYGPYGFTDGFNLDKQWFSREYLAIDQGVALLMIQNYRNQLIWNRFMDLPPIQRWIELCGLEPHSEKA